MNIFIVLSSLPHLWKPQFHKDNPSVNPELYVKEAVLRKNIKKNYITQNYKKTSDHIYNL